MSRVSQWPKYGNCKSCPRERGRWVIRRGGARPLPESGCCSGRPLRAPLREADGSKGHTSGAEPRRYECEEREAIRGKGCETI